MGVDTGFVGCGACIYDVAEDTLVRVEGTVTKSNKKASSKGIDDIRRIKELWAFLDRFYDGWPIGLVVAEIPGGSQSASGAKSGGIAKALITCWTQARHLPLRTYTPHACKKAATGNGNADKDDVQKAVMDRWPMALWPIGEKNFEDAADSTAVILAWEQDGKSY
jgi:Holliday junction resolvasome RuvABC endonuclease subunit